MQEGPVNGSASSVRARVRTLAAVLIAATAATASLTSSARADPGHAGISRARARALESYHRDQRLAMQRPKTAARARPAKPRARTSIVSGVQDSISEIPWQVAIFAEYEAEGEKVSSLCGGILIDQSHVLTAAHCTYDPVTGKPLAAGSFAVVAGATTITAEEIAKGKTVQARLVSSLRTHPYFDYELGAGATDDVAVLKLAEPVHATADVASATLPTSDTNPEVGEDLLMSGYGEENGTTHELNGSLYTIGSGVEPPSVCGGEAAAVVICTKNTGGASCGGDAGGPVEDVIGGARTVVGVLDAVQVIEGHHCHFGAINTSANLTAPEVRDFVEGNEAPPRAPRGGKATLTGAPQVGQSITCTPSGWSNTPTFNYSFLNSEDGAVLEHGSSPSFAITEPDLGLKILCRMEATNAGGSATATSAPLGPVKLAPFVPPPAAEGHAPEPDAGSAGTGGESWFSAAPMRQPRAGQTANLLPDGDVLVAGGYNGFIEEVGGSHTNLATAELFDPSTGTWTAAPSLLVARSFQNSVSLKDGRVLLIGGWESSSDSPPTAEIYDPRSNSWTVTPIPAELQSVSSATLLPSGWVFLLGDFGPTGYESTQRGALYDPATNAWEPTSHPKHPRADETVLTLANGDVMTAGGDITEGTWPETHIVVEKTVEEYDPNTNTWTELAPMEHARASETATVMPEGKVLVTGGVDEMSLFESSYYAVNSTEMYDPHANSWTARAPMNLARDSHSATLLPDGDVLVAGGGDCGEKYCLGGGRGPADDCCAASSAEVFDPATDAWTFTGPELTGTEHTATVLANGGVLVTGGNLEPVAMHELNTAEVFASRYPPDERGPTGGSSGGEVAGTITALAPTRPRIETLSQTHRIWRTGSRLASLARSPHIPVGTAFDVTVNETASLHLALTHQLAGRQVGRNCDAPTRQNRHARACTRTLTAGRLNFSAHTGRNVISFQGRLPHGITLAPGVYTVEIFASNAAGHSRTLRLSFTIAR